MLRVWTEGGVRDGLRVYRVSGLGFRVYGLRV